MAPGERRHQSSATVRRRRTYRLFMPQVSSAL
jgi:hypothetical protein